MECHNDVRDGVACSIEIMATLKTEKSKVSPFQNLLFSFSVRTYSLELKNDYYYYTSIKSNKEHISYARR